MQSVPTEDGRRQRGDRTRRTVAQQAAALASIDGLSGVTLAQVADALGVSKSSVQAAYATKEQLQLAAIEAATETFMTEVIAPALEQPEGLARLRALADSWLQYVERLVFPGGCFMVATLSEYDSRPGPVRDAIREARGAWLKLLESQAQVAVRAGEIPGDPSPALVAFEVDALLSMANVQRNIEDDVEALEQARQLIDLRLPPIRRGSSTGRRRHRRPAQG